MNILRLGFLFFLFYANPTALFASDFSIPEIDVQVVITEDGIVQIREQRTYTFDGDFSWADYRISKEGFSDIRNIRVSEGDSSYINLNTEEEGTFSFSESDDAVVIKWNYTASDTVRTFTLSYELAGAVAIGLEWSSLFRNYLASGREKSTSVFNLSVRFPQSISSDSLHTWQRDKATDFQINKQERSIEFSGSDISRQEAAIIRVVFPTAVFDENQVQVTHPNLTLTSISTLEEDHQQQQQEQAERDAYFAEITPTVTIILSLTSILIFILLYKKYGSRHSTGQIASRETLVIPGQQPPALIGKLLLSRQTTSNHLVATIFDLARRGWLKIREEEKGKENDGWFSEDKAGFKVSLPNRDPDDTLSEYEKMTMGFIRSQLSVGTDTFEEIFSSNDSSAAKWYSKWTKQVKKAFDEQNWIDKGSYRGVIANSVVQFLLMCLSIAMLIVGSPVAIIAAIITLALVIASFAIIRRTPDGEEVYQRWKNYRDGLKNADERTIRMEMLDRHFIFATALHLSKKRIETILEAPQASTADMIPWIILAHGSTTSPAAMASSFSTLAATGSTSFAGTTGAGTGASVTSVGGGVSGGAG